MSFRFFFFFLFFTFASGTKGESPMVLQGRATRLEIVNNPRGELQR